MQQTQRLTPLKAIRAKCLECSCNSVNEVKHCPIDSCSLFPYRLGKNPYIKREYTEEQRAAMRERAKKSISGRRHRLNNRELSHKQFN